MPTTPPLPSSSDHSSEDRTVRLHSLDVAAALQGATAGLTMSLIAFQLAGRSLTLAGIFSAAVAVGMMSSRLLRRLDARPVSVLMTVARTVALFAAYANVVPVSVLAGAVAGSASRRLTLDLKHQVGDIEPAHLVTHGTWNAISFGVGAAAAGVLLEHPLIAQLVAFVVALGAAVVYLDGDEHDVEESSGLTRRDLVATVVFSFASNPLSNATAPLILLGTVSSGVVVLSCFAYTLGALAAPNFARALHRFNKPVAVATALSAGVFAIMLLVPNPVVVFAARALTGALLFAGQGIMEMRSKRAGDGKGLEHLWTLLSAAGVVANFVVPYSVEQSSLWTAPLWTFAGALVIMSLSRIPMLR